MSRSSDAPGGSFLQLGTALAYQTPGSSSDALACSFPQTGNSSNDALAGSFPQPGIQCVTRARITRLLLRFLPMFDSHFHLARLSTTVGEQVCSLDDICRVCPLLQFENHTLKLTGATSSYCDRETLPRPEDIASLVRSGFKVMVEAHQMVILTPEERWRVKKLFQLPEVSGLGEVGLDHTTSPDLWHRQERQLKDLVTG